MPPTTKYTVRVQYDTREKGHDFGPFADRDNAEQCVIAACERPDVLTAKIIEETV